MTFVNLGIYVNIQICTINLEKRFGSLRAICNLNIDTGLQWQCLGILGRNGAGKTTLLRILVGLLQQSAGSVEIKINGHTWSHADPQIATYLAEQTNLINSITGRQYLRLYDAMNQIVGVETKKELRDELIEKFSLGGELTKLVVQMSKGTKRKLEVVAAVSSQVDLIITDELTEGLDITSRIVLEVAIKDMAQSGKRFLVSSHDLSFVTSVCDSIIIIDHGKCIDTFQVSEEASNMKERVASAFNLTSCGLSKYDNKYK